MTPRTPRTDQDPPQRPTQRERAPRSATDITGPEVARRRQALLVVALLVTTVLTHWVVRSSRADFAPGDDFRVGDGLPATTSASSGAVTFHGHLDRTAVVQGGDGVVALELTLSAEERLEQTASTPTDLVVVLDRSGSMQGSKMVEARRAVHALVDRLGAADRFALVSYSSDARIDVPLSQPDGGEERSGWHRQIDAVEVGGGTNLSAGIDRALVVLGQRQSGRVGRVLVVSDGLANAGDATHEGLVARAQTATRHELAMSTIGVGADFNEVLLTALANVGAGNFYYLAEDQLGDGNGTQLASMLEGELEAGRRTVAQGLEVRLAPAPGVRVIDVAGYPIESVPSGSIFRPGDLFAGQERRVWVKLEVPHTVVGASELGSFELSWREGDQRHRVALPALPQIACVADPTTAVASIDSSVWERSVRDEGYGALQQEVSQYVREGRRAEALESIDRFRDRVSTLNETVASAEVEATLEQAVNLQIEVDDAFQGADQAAKQNLLSKKELAAAWDARRQGSKIETPEVPDIPETDDPR